MPIKEFNADPIEWEEVDPQSVENEWNPNDKWNIDDKDLEKHITTKQQLFCQCYISDVEVFWNWTRSYAKAYGVDLEADPMKYNSCQSMASRLLWNVLIGRYINKLLTDIIPNEWIDKLLTQLALQNNNPRIKIEAIKELNKLRGRITDKITLNTEQNPLEDFNSKVKEAKKKAKK